MSAFPPHFSRFGCSLNDLLSKKYNFKNQIISKNALASDLAFETTMATPSGDKFGSSFAGKVKATYKNRDFGDLETELDTDGPVKAEFKTSKLARGVTLTATGTHDPSGKLVVDYRNENVALSGGVNVKSDSTTIEANGVFGYEGVAVGLSGKYNCSTNEVTESEAGVQYSKGDYTLAAVTSERAEKLALSFYHQLPSRKAGLKTVVGGKLDASIHSPLENRTFTLAAEHDLDSCTNVRGKMDTRGMLTTLVEHRFDNPAFKAGLSAMWDTSKKTTTADKVGFTMTFEN